MAKLIITLFTIVLLLSFALCYAAGADVDAAPAGSSANLKITPGGPTFKGTADMAAIKAQQQVINSFFLIYTHVKYIIIRLFLVGF